MDCKFAIANYGSRRKCKKPPPPRYHSGTPPGKKEEIDLQLDRLTTKNAKVPLTKKHEGNCFAIIRAQRILYNHVTFQPCNPSTIL